MAIYGIAMHPISLSELDHANSAFVVLAEPNNKFFRQLLTCAFRLACHQPARRSRQPR